MSARTALGDGFADARDCNSRLTRDERRVEAQDAVTHAREFAQGLHSAIGYVSPLEYELTSVLHKEAA